jgi:hypothetical protein
MLLKRLSWRVADKESGTVMRSLRKDVHPISPRIRNLFPQMRDGAQAFAQNH